MLMFRGGKIEEIFLQQTDPRKIQDSVRTRRLEKTKGLADIYLLPLMNFGGVDGTRTRDPRRDRPVF